MGPDCELCQAARFTHWYFEDAICWVADCEACNVPMVVWKQHRVDPTDAQLRHMEEQLAAAARQRFDREEWRIDDDRRSIPDHFHLHARDADWFTLRSQRQISTYNGVGVARSERP